jgi:2-hydroxy-3-oxopropionate reductase
VSTIAFIGLGIMGSPMAVNLARAGHQVTGYNRSPERAAALVNAGGAAADSIATAVRDTDIVALMIHDSPDVDSVLTTDNGVFDSPRPATLIIDFSSIRPDVTTTLSTRASDRGFRMIDAPVSGGEIGAINAQLSIMVGGTNGDFAAAQPVLDTVGAPVVHLGSSGSGQTVVMDRSRCTCQLTRRRPLASSHVNQPGRQGDASARTPRDEKPIHTRRQR